MVKIKKNISLKNLSTFKIGGRVRFFCEVRNDKELLESLRMAKKLRIPYKIIAGGSNVVFPDKILNCLLIKIKSNRLKIIKNKIIIDAGVSLLRVIAAANRRGLRGLETLDGIPGTIGGAIVGNAGAYGHSISEVVERVEMLNETGDKRWVTNRNCKFEYRESVFKKKPYIILRAVFNFQKGLPADGRGNPEKLQKISRNIIKIRLKKYKPGLRCPGSFFKNVLISGISKKSLALIDKNKIIDGKIPAGYLLEEVSAKGMKLGGTKIADFHGNLFVNTGGAKAAEVERLAKILKSKVQKKFHINLEEEIHYF